jgi:hypothetical protein
VVITRGRLAAHGPVAELAAATSSTRIRTPDTAQLMTALARDGITARLADAGNLEDLFFDLTRDRTMEASPS